MNDSPLQLAKRELHNFSRSRTAWIATVSAGILLGLAGPFSTDEIMRVIPRMAYWSLIAVVTYLTGLIIDAILRPRLTGRVPFWVAVGLTALLSASMITLEILIVNALAFAFWPSWLELGILAGNVFAASVVINTAISLIAQNLQEKGQNDPHAQPDQADGQPRLMARLPLAKRGDLVSLSAVDHYVEVTTTQGSELVLMRLSDAMEETAPVEGMQIHRSHWVALAHVQDVRRVQSRTELVLSDARVLPVSRSNVSALKVAGLLAS